MPPHCAASVVSATSSSVSANVAGRIDERGADTERAFLHRLANQAAHPLAAARDRVDIAFAKLMLADGGRADERGDVQRRPPRSRQRQIFAEASSIRSDI